MPVWGAVGAAFVGDTFGMGWDGSLRGKEEKGSLESKPFMRFLDGWEGKEQNYV